MNKINCSIDNCSHNKANICYAARVDISGRNATTTEDTCCGSFLDKRNYSDLTSSTNNGKECDCLICKVNSCSHNQNNLCSLDSIQVNAMNNVQLYTETNCSSFMAK